MNQILINRLIDNFERQISNTTNNEKIDTFNIYSATFYEFKEYVLNALKQLNSKMKKITIVVGNSNNYIG
jgi:ACT domain-containing protein